MNGKHHSRLDTALGDGRSDLEQSLSESVNRRLTDGRPTELHLLDGATNKASVFAIQRLQPVPHRFVASSRSEEPHLKNGRG